MKNTPQRPRGKIRRRLAFFENESGAYFTCGAFYIIFYSIFLGRILLQLCGKSAEAKLDPITQFEKNMIRVLSTVQKLG